MLELGRHAAGDDIVVLALSGHIDISNCFRLEDGLNEEIEAGRRGIVLDLEGLSFIDSSCLGILLRALERVHREHGVMVIVGNEFVDRVLTLTGLTHLLVSYPNEKAAIAAVRREQADRRRRGPGRPT